MKRIVLFCAAAMLAMPMMVHAADAKKSKAPAMDPKEMQEMMMKAAAPGPQHEMFKKMEGEWDLKVTSVMDPTQPPQESKGTSTVKTLMDGRYCQEQSTGDMMGMPFSGLGITGYDNVAKKYVSVWMDNMGTGIMKSEGTASKDDPNTIIYWSESLDPMTGKLAKYRMVSHMLNDDHHTFEMYGKGPDGKEAKMMSIDYARKSPVGSN